VDEPHKAKAELATVLDANRVSLFGGKLHVLAQSEEEMALAARALARGGIAARAQKRIVPSLEDVFINQVAQREAEHVS
jgi:ABC-2 type transport system ATP-binding protein